MTSTGSSSRWTLWQKLREPLVSAFIVLNVIAIALVLAPAFPSRQILLKPFLAYLFATGLFQGSGVFVPRPHVYNIYLTAEIIYSDGSEEEWKSPRMEDLGLLERFQKERFRKWSRQNMDTPRPLKWWPETAAYLARVHQRNGKTPIEIRLVRHRTDTAPPGSNEQRETKHDVFYVHKVRPEDLR